MSAPRAGSRRFLAVFLLAALLLAGVASYYASSHPDGLEYVAGKVGFEDRADDSAATKSPLADYSTKGLENDRISGGVAGVAGSLLVLVLAGAMFRVLRRREPASAPSSRDTA